MSELPENCPICGEQMESGYILGVTYRDMKDIWIDKLTIWEKISKELPWIFDYLTLKVKIKKLSI